MNNETDTSRAFRVETLTDEQFAGHVATLQSPLASLNPNMEDYGAIKKYLLFAAEWRAQAGDNLRHTAQTKVTVAAQEGEFTAGYKTARLMKLRTNLCKARDCYLYAYVASTDGWRAAQEVVGADPGIAMTEDQRKKLEALRKKKDEKSSKLETACSSQVTSSSKMPEVNALLLAQVLQQQVAQQNPLIYSKNLLGYNGPALRKRTRAGIDKSTSTCFTCQGIGHWSGDDICPMQDSKKKAAGSKELD